MLSCSTKGIEGAEEEEEAPLSTGNGVTETVSEVLKKRLGSLRRETEDVLQEWSL